MRKLTVILALVASLVIGALLLLPGPAWAALPHPASPLFLPDQATVLRDAGGWPHSPAWSPGAAGLASPLFTTTTWLPEITKCYPAIRITRVPPYGSTADDWLRGWVNIYCFAPVNYRTAVYIFVVGGWWTKPYWHDPLTPIRSDGTWETDVVTGGVDELATRFVACLVPAGYDPPRGYGEPQLPPALFQHAVDCVYADRSPVYRNLQFSGYTWQVKAANNPVGPGPNYFSDRPEDVWVDGNGQLHLRIVPRDGRWYCSEVITSVPLGYGVYTFTLASQVDQLDKQAVLGLFTWDDAAPEHNYHEIDIEFARWGEAEVDNAQYVVQPWSHAGNLHRFAVNLSGAYSTHIFAWQSGAVQFASFQGRATSPGPADQIAAWRYAGDDVPPAGASHTRINLWLYNGQPPSDSQPIEIVIAAFQFVPLS